MRADACLRAIGCATAVLWCSATAFAQAHPGSTYAIGGFAVSHQSGVTGESSQTYVAAPGGNTLGWLIGGGVFVASAVSVEGEIASTGLMTARQPSRYGMTFNEERRDRFVSLTARFHLPATGRFRLEPVVGMAITSHQAWSQTDYYRFWLMPQEVLVKGTRQRRQLHATVGPTFGCDARIGGRHVALLPYFRISDSGKPHGFSADSTEPREIESFYPGGYPRWTMRTGVGVRVDFGR
jgi:hypothetical protein